MIPIHQIALTVLHYNCEKFTIKVVSLDIITIIYNVLKKSFIIIKIKYVVKYIVLKTQILKEICCVDYD